jgi:hypothetical protein
MTVYIVCFILFTIVYRRAYHMSSACPFFGHVVAYHMFSACTKIDHVHFASSHGISRWYVLNITVLCEVMQALQIGGSGTDSTPLHCLFSTYTYWVIEPVHVPLLEEGKIQADVARIEPVISLHLSKPVVHMVDIIHPSTGSG